MLAQMPVPTLYDGSPCTRIPAAWTHDWFRWMLTNGGCPLDRVRHSGKIHVHTHGTDGALLTRRIPNCWTPYFGRNFLPSATAALNFGKSDRDNLGGWSAQGSDVYARVARHKITTMQKAEGSTLRSQVEGDPSAETEKVLQLHVCRTQRNVPFAEVRDTLARLSIWKTTLADGILGLDCASASAQRYSARQNSISLTKTWRFCQSHRQARRGEDSSPRKQPSRTASSHPREFSSRFLRVAKEIGQNVAQT